MSYNVFYGNHNFGAIAGIIKNAVHPDIVTMEEAVGNIAPETVKKLNSMGGGTWELANPWSKEHYWCGLTAYRSDKWDMLWHKEIQVKQAGDPRGLCGALLKRKADGVKVCVWGTHPIFQKKNAPGNLKWRGEEKWAMEVISKGGEVMKECAAQGGTTSAFLCDCNTDEDEPLRRKLEESTGWKWKLAGSDRYDKIFIQEDPNPAKASIPHGFKSWNPNRRGYWDRYCQKRCMEPTWGYADHPPVYVEVTPK